MILVYYLFKGMIAGSRKKSGNGLFAPDESKNVSMKRTRNPGEGGFTLIELMVVMVIAAIILGLAVPSLSDFIARSRTLSATNDLVAFLNYARSEAIKRGERVVLCHSIDGKKCGGSSWVDGGITFVDDDRDTNVDESDDIILRKLEGLSKHVTVTDGGKVVYLPTGNTTTARAFTVVGGSDSDMKRRVCVSNSGRVESKKYSDACT